MVRVRKSLTAFVLIAIMAVTAAWTAPSMSTEGADPSVVVMVHEDADGNRWTETLPVPEWSRTTASPRPGSEGGIVYTVTDPSDAADDSLEDNVPFPNTFRAVVQTINYLGTGPNTILFDPGITQINIASSMPFLNVPTVVDGGSPRVIFDGSAMGAGQPAVGEWAMGLSSGAAGSRIESIEVQNFPDGGIVVSTSNAEVYNSVFHDNDGAGILGNGTFQCQIGDTLPDKLNYIYNHTSSSGDGIQLILGSHQNKILGNYIGTNDGQSRAANSRSGIQISGNQNQIHRNVISGNDLNGVQLGQEVANPSLANSITLNYIGLTIDGMDTLGNGLTTSDAGIDIRYGSQDTIAYNFISGNRGYGIEFSTRVTHAHVFSNSVGTGTAGTGRLGNRANGMLLRGDSNLVEYNHAAANRFSGIAIQGTANVVQKNCVGALDPGDTTGNSTFGIQIGGSENIVGGLLPSDFNLVSGNQLGGILVSGFGNFDNLIMNNIVGTDTTGTIAMPNLTFGIGIFDSSFNTVVIDNLVASNGEDGILIQHSFGRRPRNTVIMRNIIGKPGLGNGRDGVRIDSASFTQVGDTAIGPVWNHITDNGGHGVYIIKGTSGWVVNDTIWNNAGDGVRIDGGLYNAIAEVSIWNNGGLGIDLFGDGPDPVDSADTDTGPNEFQNVPYLDSVMVDPAFIRVFGELWSAPGETFYLEAYVSPDCDPLGVGEGKDYIGVSSVSTGGDGKVDFDLVFLHTLTPSSRYVTLKVTDSLFNTSEFSACMALTIDSADIAVEKRAIADTVLIGDTVTFAVTVRNYGPDDATLVQLSDSLPPGVTFVSSTGTCVPVGQVLNCDLGTIVAGDSVQISVRVQADSLGWARNLAAVTAAELDPDLADNGAVDSVWVDALVGVGHDASVLPSDFALHQNYPNPFNPATTFEFAVPRVSHVTLEIYNALGQRVARLVDGVTAPGVYTVTWDGRNDRGVETGSGMYFYRLTTPEKSLTRKMLLLR